MGVIIIKINILFYFLIIVIFLCLVYKPRLIFVSRPDIGLIFLSFRFLLGIDQNGQNGLKWTNRSLGQIDSRSKDGNDTSVAGFSFVTAFIRIDRLWSVSRRFKTIYQFVVFQWLSVISRSFLHNSVIHSLVICVIRPRSCSQNKTFNIPSLREIKTKYSAISKCPTNDWFEIIFFSQI